MVVPGESTLADFLPMDHVFKSTLLDGNGLDWTQLSPEAAALEGEGPSLVVLPAFLCCSHRPGLVVGPGSSVEEGMRKRGRPSPESPPSRPGIQIQVTAYRAPSWPLDFCAVTSLFLS